MNRYEDNAVTRYKLLGNGDAQYYDPLWHDYPDYLFSDSVDIDQPYGKVLSLEVASDDKRNYRNFEKRIQEASRSSGTLRRNMVLLVFDEV
jgi:hypothetical protein